MSVLGSAIHRTEMILRVAYSLGLAAYFDQHVQPALCTFVRTAKLRFSKKCAKSMRRVADTVGLHIQQVGVDSNKKIWLPDQV
jgi:hypothetical protein